MKSLFCLFQSTPPREGGDDTLTVTLVLGDISIHAPREGGDTILPESLPSARIFQSTPPARGATDG